MCQKWNKIDIKYHLNDDKVVFKQRIHQIENLHLTVSRVVQEKYEHENFGKKLDNASNAEFEIVKLAEPKSPGMLTSQFNTTDSSFHSDLKGMVEGNKKMSKAVEKKLERLGVEESPQKE